MALVDLQPNRPTHPFEAPLDASFADVKRFRPRTGDVCRQQTVKLLGESTTFVADATSTFGKHPFTEALLVMLWMSAPMTCGPTFSKRKGMSFAKTLMLVESTTSVNKDHPKQTRYVELEKCNL